MGLEHVVVVGIVKLHHGETLLFVEEDDVVTGWRPVELRDLLVLDSMEVVKLILGDLGFVGSVRKEKRGLALFIE